MLLVARNASEPPPTEQKAIDPAIVSRVLFRSWTRARGCEAEVGLRQELPRDSSILRFFENLRIA